MRTSFLFLSTLVTLSMFGAVVEPRQPADRNTVRVLVPAFAGGDSGKAVATLINLQIWKTLRIAPSAEVKLQGEVAWDKPLREQSFEAAEAAARQSNALAVVWGDVIEAGDGVIVQGHLSLPELDRTRAFQQWSVPLRYDKKQDTLQVGLLHRRYDFEPITLSRKLLQEYQSLSDLPLYQSPTSDKIIGRIAGEDFRALTQEDDAVQVLTASHRSGWVQLRNLAQLQNEIAGFTSALVMLFRYDWTGAEKLFTSVLKRENIPQAVRIDSYLYRAIARYNAKHPGSTEDVQAALDLNPYVRTSAATQLVLYAAIANELENAGDAEGSKRMRLRIIESAKRHRFLFGETDAVLTKVEEFVTHPPVT